MKASTTMQHTRTPIRPGVLTVAFATASWAEKVRKWLSWPSHKENRWINGVLARLGQGVEMICACVVCKLLLVRASGQDGSTVRLSGAKVT